MFRWIIAYKYKLHGEDNEITGQRIVHTQAKDESAAIKKLKKSIVNNMRAEISCFHFDVVSCLGIERIDGDVSI